MQFILIGNMEVFGEAVLIMGKIMGLDGNPCSPRKADNVDLNSRYNV